MSGQNTGIGSDPDVDRYNFLSNGAHNTHDWEEGFQSGSSFARSATLHAADGKGILTKGHKIVEHFLRRS